MVTRGGTSAPKQDGCQGGYNDNLTLKQPGGIVTLCFLPLATSPERAGPSQLVEPIYHFLQTLPASPAYIQEVLCPNPAGLWGKGTIPRQHPEGISVACKHAIPVKGGVREADSPSCVPWGFWGLLLGTLAWSFTGL